MTAKKISIVFVLFITGLYALFAFGGGPEVGGSGEYYQTVFLPVFRPSMYIEGFLGYAAVDWRRMPDADGGFGGGGPFDPDFEGHERISNGRGAFAGGGDLGFRFTRYLSAELGAYSLPHVKGVSDGTVTRTIDTPLTISDGFGYVAGRAMVNLYANIDVFGKVGVAFRGLFYGGNELIRKNDGYARPVLAAGLKYQVDDYWMISFQYIYLPANLNARPVTARAPAANLILAGLGYAFPL